MCGLAGFFSFQGSFQKTDAARTLNAMADCLRHRGPDGNGIWTGDLAGLAHTRLSIIDRSPAGHQPMEDGDGTVKVVFNGEIYNHRDLRVELEAAGHRFRSDHCDTEVIVHGYKQWGCDVFRHLRGMFAIAIWDVRERRLVLARDRGGQKPLYYAPTGDAFVFGSEIKAILKWPGIKRQPDYDAIHYYLTYQYVPAPKSAFEGIFKLRPGHYLIVDGDGGIKEEPYWRLPEPQLARPRPWEDLKAELVALLREATRMQMMSDVPLGAFLSGGIDSSSIVAFMAEASAAPVKTFSIGFKEAEFDETRYARMVAERYATDHEEFIVEPDAVSILPRIIWQYGEPFADSSAIPTYYVAKLARRKVTVALSGDGSDESFIGYPRYANIDRENAGDRLPRPLRNLLGHAAHRLPAQGQAGRLRRILERVSNRESRRYAPFIVSFQEQQKDRIYGEVLRPYISPSALDLLDPYFSAAPSRVSGAAWADLHTYLPDDILTKVDVSSMTHSLEVRSPFMDHVLMEWAAAIPAEQKMQDGVLKALLKEAMKPFLPDEVINRPKMGFGVPVDRWMRNEMRDFLYDTLLSEKSRNRGLFDMDVVRETLDSHCDNREDNQTRIWGMLMLELWHLMWIDPPDADTIEAPAA